MITDGLSSYPSVLAGYEHQSFNVSASGKPAHESLPAVHRLFSQVKRMMEGTYQGSGSVGPRGEYLDEFIFRFNRRTSTHRGMVFYRLLQRAVTAEPVAYQVLETSSPRAYHRRASPGLVPSPAASSRCPRTVLGELRTEQIPSILGCYRPLSRALALKWILLI